MLLPSCHIKEPSLIHYDDTKASNDMDRLLLDEAEVYEALRTKSHPNIAQYLGRRVTDGRITSYCFVKYGVYLSKFWTVTIVTPTAVSRASRTA